MWRQLPHGGSTDLPLLEMPGGGITGGLPEAWRDKIITLKVEFDLTVAGSKPGDCQIKSRSLHFIERFAAAPSVTLRLPQFGD